MPQYPQHLYQEFVARAQEHGSGLGKTWHRDGSLRALGALLRRDSTAIQLREAIAALGRERDPVHGSKLRKYRDAVAFLENTFPIAPGLRQAPIGMGIEAVRYRRSPLPPQAQFNGPHLNHASLRLASSSAQLAVGETVPDFMAANAAGTRVLLIHLGQPQGDMARAWDGLSALDHMNAVLAAAAEHQIHVCILCDPHQRGRGQGLPTPANAVCAGLRHAVGQLPGTHVWVADGGDAHSAFHDPAFQPWVSHPAVNAVVVMGFDADICVRGNVFGVAETVLNAQPPRLVPALINVADVITARPLLSGGNAGAVQAFQSWGRLCFTQPD